MSRRNRHIVRRLRADDAERRRQPSKPRSVPQAVTGGTLAGIAGVVLGGTLLAAFIDGLSRILDIGGTAGPTVPDLDAYRERDSLAMASDWMVVGDDLRASATVLTRSKRIAVR